MSRLQEIKVLRRRITEAELRRDLYPNEWNSFDVHELLTLKEWWLRVVGKEWKGV